VNHGASRGAMHEKMGVPRDAKAFLVQLYKPLQVIK